MSRDDIVPVLPLPLSTFEWLWGIAESKLLIAQQPGHDGYSDEYKVMVEAAAKWGRETAVEVLGREPPKKPVPKRSRKRAQPAPAKAAPERPKPKVRLVRKKK